jgi:hypothetical protein
VGKSKGSTGLHSSEYLLVQLSLSSIGNQKDDKVGLSDGLEHLSEGSVLLTESTILSLSEGRRSLTESNGYLNVCSSLIERITKILCLSRSLGSPSDNSNILNSLESLRKKGEKITSSLNDGLLGISKVNLYRCENIGLKSVTGKRDAASETKLL